MKTQQLIETTRELLNKRAKAINESTNDMQGSPYWNTCKRYVKLFFKQNGISEISILGFEQLSGLNSEYAKQMLLEINKELFNKTNKD